MTPAAPLTEARCRAAVDAAPAEEELRLYDSKVPGLLLWRRPGGWPRWYVFKRAGGRMCRLPVGELCRWPDVPVEQARVLAKGVVAKLAEGADPAQQRRQARVQRREAREGGRVPLAEVLKRHLAMLAERGRSGPHVAELERVAREAIAAGVVDLASPSVAAQARTWLDGLEVSPPTRHRYRVHLGALAKTALRWWPPAVLGRDPFLPLTGEGPKLPPPPVFDPAEAARLAGDEALALPGGRLWCFLLLTGCRFKEATWARWGRIDLDRATFDVVPPDAAERKAGARVKRDKPRTVHLGKELVALLRDWKPAKAAPADFLFPDEWRTRPHVRNVFAFRDHLAALDIPLNERRIHSLRHTRQTLGLAAGEDSLRLRLAMGHAGEEMAAHYGRLAMRWRGLLSGWDGELRLRHPVEAKRLAKMVGTGEMDAASADRLPRRTTR